MATCCQTGKQSTPKSEKRLTLPARVVLLPVFFYRYFISPLLGPRCRFEPSCSSYAIDALATWGIGKGSVLAIRRIVKCHPWHEGGYDPVPENNKIPSKH